MTVKDDARPAGGQVVPPADVDQAEVLRLRVRFRGHQIFCVVSASRAVRYVAYGTALDVRPHTIITDDLAELRDELEQAICVPPKALSNPGPGEAGG